MFAPTGTGVSTIIRLPHGVPSADSLGQGTPEKKEAARERASLFGGCLSGRTSVAASVFTPRGSPVPRGVVLGQSESPPPAGSGPQMGALDLDAREARFQQTDEIARRALEQNRDLAARLAFYETDLKDLRSTMAQQAAQIEALQRLVQELIVGQLAPGRGQEP